jgi:hypothetical protein
LQSLRNILYAQKLSAILQKLQDLDMLRVEGEPNELAFALESGYLGTDEARAAVREFILRICNALKCDENRRDGFSVMWS